MSKPGSCLGLAVRRVLYLVIMYEMFMCMCVRTTIKAVQLAKLSIFKVKAGIVAG